MATGAEKEEDNQSPLLLSSSSLPSSSVLHPLHSVPKRTVAAWSLAQLGWIAGPLSMLCFASIILFSTFLLSNCYRYPDPVHGPSRNRSYLQAVHINLGERSAWICGLVNQTTLYGVGIAYTITSATSMRAIQESNCYPKYGHQATCKFGDTYYMLLFGAVQIVMSQIPDFHSIEWLSIVAAVMSFMYSFIGLGLRAAKVIGNGVIKGSIKGISTSSTPQKLWLVSLAVGDIAFSYPYSIIFIEIQDTLKSSPPENDTMKKATFVSICITTFFYLCCGGFGYAALGDQTPGNLLTGFGFYEPNWLIDFANACIVLRLVGGFQVYSRPVFAVVEKWCANKFPNSGLVNITYTLQLPYLPVLRLNLLRLCFRTAYVTSTTAIAMLFPEFNRVLGVLGAINFWPLSIYFPVKMNLLQRNIGSWTKKWIAFQTFGIVCLLITVIAFVGSFEGLITAKFS